MKFVGIETSGECGSVALGEDGAVVAERQLGSGAVHGRMLVSGIGRLLTDRGWQRHQLSAVAVSAGPGSLTGVRVGVSVAKALAYANRLPVYPVSSLLVLTRNADGFEGLVCPVIDAFGGRLCCGAWRMGKGTRKECEEEFVGPITQVIRRLKRIRRRGEATLLVGDGAVRYTDVFTSAGLGVAGEVLAAARAAAVVEIAMETARAEAGSEWAAVMPHYMAPPQVKEPRRVRS